MDIERETLTIERQLRMIAFPFTQSADIISDTPHLAAWNPRERQVRATGVTCFAVAHFGRLLLKENLETDCH
jgi:hypothetical protein